jgi:hypothetical protein
MIIGGLLACVLGGALFTIMVPVWVFVFGIFGTAIAFFGASLMAFLI